MMMYRKSCGSCEGCLTGVHVDPVFPQRQAPYSSLYLRKIMEIVGIKQLADVFGQSEKAWKDRIAAGMPVAIRAESRGKPHVFDSEDVLTWLLAQASGISAGDLNPQQERARLDAARRRLCELQAAERERELIPVDVVERVWSRITSDARQRFLAMPSTLLPSLLAADGDPAKLVEAVTEQVFQALTDVAEMDIERYV